MDFSWRLLIVTLEALMIACGVVSVVLRFREWGKVKFTVANWRGFSVFFLGAGTLFSLPAFLSQDPAATLFGLFSLPVLYAALLAANQRVRWDTKGFWYRTAFRREIRYEFEDVRKMRPLPTGRAGQDLFVNAGGRRFLLDETTGWERFASAYNDWRTRNQLPSWDRERQERFLERYRRHGPFGKKLDRVPFGRLWLWLSLIFGVFLGALAVFFFVGMAIGKIKASPITCLCGAFGLFVSVYMPARYVYAVNHLDDKPRLICRFICAQILPDPDKPRTQKKVYRKKK